MDPGRCNRTEVVTAFLREADVPYRRVAGGEWGATIEVSVGPPLHLGLRVVDGLLTVQAWVSGPGGADPHTLLHRHRRRPLVRYAHSAAGDVHVQGELPLEGLTPASLDRLVGALVEAAELARQAASRRARSR
jgi:hypothetical protein